MKPSFQLGVTLVLAATIARATAAPEHRLYELSIETGMPHLEENLRYANHREVRCLSHLDLASAFPILTHPSLAGCALTHETRNGVAVSYQLVCSSGHGTTGQATWDLGAQRFEGTLWVKLGGKNMTFSQHVTARMLQRCDPGVP